MQPMHGRLSDPSSYQGLQHFITHSTWEARPFWQRLRAFLPVRRGVLAIDDTGLPTLIAERLPPVMSSVQ